jgi:hypothetical protein
VVGCWPWPKGAPTVILLVIPPRATPQDGTVSAGRHTGIDLGGGTGRDATDGWEATHNPPRTAGCEAADNCLRRTVSPRGWAWVPLHMNAGVVPTCDKSRRWCKNVAGKRLLSERIVESDYLGCFSRSWHPATRQYENTAQPAVATLWGRSRAPESAVVFADGPCGIRIAWVKRDGIIAIESIDSVLGVARVVSRTDENGKGLASVVIPATDLAAQAATQPTHTGCTNSVMPGPKATIGSVAVGGVALRRGRKSKASSTSAPE